MQTSPSLFGTPRDWAVDLAIATGIGVFLGVIGPFGSFYGGSLELRLFYWVANLWIGFVVLSLIVRLSLKVGARLDLPVWFALPAGAAVGALPLGFIVAVFSALVWPPNHGRVSRIDIWYFQTLAIALPGAFFYYFLKARVSRPPSPTGGDGGTDCDPPGAPTPSPSDGRRLIDRLPPRLGRELLCLQMEDHYVRVHTARGSELLLMPLRDAMAEVAGVEGMQVHRSWWVARAAVAGVVEEGRSLRLRLVNGVEAPVSRSFVAPLRANRWLDSDFGPVPGG